MATGNQARGRGDDGRGCDPRAEGGDDPHGGLVAFLEYVQRFYKPVQDLAEKFNILQSAMAAAERIFAVLDSKPEITDPAEPSAAGRGYLDDVIEPLTNEYQADQLAALSE